MNTQIIKIWDKATLTAYLHSSSEEMQSQQATKRAAMIICPGGGYEFCSDREADAPAFAFANMGMQVFVLHYSVGADAGGKRPLKELAMSVRILRDNCQEWQIDPEKIVVCGFSAGGHLAASLGVHWNDLEIVGTCDVTDVRYLRPNAVVLCYPVISAGECGHRETIANIRANCREDICYWSLETQVNMDTPPTFLWHTMTDPVVSVENSMLFMQQLVWNGVPCECHFYGDGPHGMSIATQEVESASEHIHSWVSLCGQWLDEIFAPEC